MTGPINGILRIIPYLFGIRISWNRMNALIAEVDQVAAPNSVKESDKREGDRISVQLENIEYEYQDDDKIFKVGPINHEFRSGEIVFITGGNGSGKTTLAKLLTGLYEPHKGRVLINGTEVSRNELGGHYSNVFSDFYLFRKLYGVDHTNKHDEIERYLDLLQIKDKLIINDGVFSTVKLSTGQRKRLALLVSYLEDRKIFIFDEWASDQDPEFRRFFYQDLLHELKQRGKCVIVITHDDRYFHVADTVLKLHMGQIELLAQRTAPVMAGHG
jgi:putative ATP-binding cassette transporter